MGVRLPPLAPAGNIRYPTQAWSQTITGLKIKVTESSTWQRTLSLEIPREHVESEEKRVLALYRKEAQIDGFRKGKAPEHLVLKRHGEAIRSDAIDEVLPAALSTALRQQSITPLTPPRILQLDYPEQGPLQVKAVVEVLPEFTVRDYKGIALEKPVRPISEQDVEEALANLADRTAELVPVERAAAFDDFLRVDIQECDEGGNPIIGRKNENRTLHLSREGEGEQIGRQLVGITPGEVRRVVVEQTAGAPEAPGVVGAQRHVFLVTVHEVKEKQMPVLDDPYARGLGDFNDLADLRTHIRADLEKQIEAESRRQMVGQLIDHLIKRHDLEVPPSLINRYLDGVIEEVKQEAGRQGQPVPDEQTIRSQYHGVAVVQLKWQILQARIAEQEEIAVSQEDVQAAVGRFAESYQLDPGQAWQVLQGKDQLDRIRSDLHEEKVVGYLLEQAKIKERIVEPPPRETGDAEASAEAPNKSGLIIPGR